ncbi:IclR family transcriptional regulator [Brucella anthropi]|uniref:IclR family transcriptional regulator n=1 Tax=Brucella anthropi TaxID=529 RepID=UPI00124EB1E1|nr:IclR family transcriptional regulator C-terminal domain-containing protein [Brucella anthropi]KAB2730817.1 helix-turn-helix domain-containing protein [Brucella anthropi]
MVTEMPVGSSEKYKQVFSAGAASAGKVPALNKAIAVIRYLNGAPSEGRSLAEISDKLGIGRSHCFNILKTLVNERWLTYDTTRRTYILAETLLDDVRWLIGGGQRAARVHAELEQLSEQVGTPCLLSRIEREGTFLVIDKAERAQQLLVSAPVGYRFAADTAAQMRVRLASLTTDEIERELKSWRPVRYTKTSLIEKADVVAEIEATRLRGYAISRAEVEPGVMTVAAPIYDTFGDVDMVLQCPGVSEVIAPRIDEIASALLYTCCQIMLIMGGKLPSRRNW